MKNFVRLIVILCSSVYIFEVSAGSVPEFTIKTGKLQLDGVKDTNIDKKCTAFQLNFRSNNAGGLLDEDSKYVIYVCYDRDAIYFACDANDDKVLSSDISQTRFPRFGLYSFYLSTEDNFDKVFVLQKNHYVFVWTPQDTSGKWGNPQIREVSASKPSFGGVGGLTKINGDLAANFVTSKSDPTSDGWYIEAAIGWDVVDVKNDAKNLMGAYYGN